MSLQTYIDAWQQSARGIASLDLTEAHGELETSLPGWSVRDIVAHLVHLEELAVSGVEGQPLSKPGITSDYTQRGVDALKGVPLAELLKRLEIAVAARAAQLDPAPEDPSSPADRTPGGIAWDWDTLLRNRAFDMWTHEQDIRGVIGTPGGQDDLGAHVTIRMLAGSLPFIVGKRAGAAPGQAVRFEITGPAGFTHTVAVGEDGRAGDSTADPLSTITMSSETFARLGSGREPLDTFEVSVTGDAALAARVLASLNVTP